MLLQSEDKIPLQVFLRHTISNRSDDDEFAAGVDQHVEPRAQPGEIDVVDDVLIAQRAHRAQLAVYAGERE